MNFNNCDGEKSILGFGLVVLDIIFKNGNKNPFYSSGGTCSNVLSNLSFLGWNSSIISRLGNDYAADLIIQDLKQSHVNIQNLYREDNIKTPRIIETLISNDTEANHKFLLKCPECQSFLPRYRSPTLNQTKSLLSTDLEADFFFYDRISPACINIANKLKSYGALVIFEPNSVKMTNELKKSLSIPHIIKFAYDENKDKEHLKIFENEILNLKDNGPLLIIKTMGRKGICFKLKNERWKHQNAIKANSIIDTCGAGDWCTAGFLYAIDKLSSFKDINLLSSLNDRKLISEALIIGQAIASVSLYYVGARGLTYSNSNQQLLNKIKILPETKDISLYNGQTIKKFINKPILKARKGSFCNICLI